MEFERQLLLVFRVLLVELLLRLHIAFIVCLVHSEWTLGQVSVLEGLLEIDHPGADNVIALEEVTIVSLNSEVVVCAWECNLEIKTVIE